MQVKTENKNSKVSFLIPTLEGGGAERVFLTLANGLAKRGFDVNLIVVDARGPYLTEVSPSVNLIDFHCKRVGNAFFKLARHLKTDKPDILISALEHTNILALLVGKFLLFKQKIIISERVFKHKSVYRSSLHYLLFRILSRLTYHTADHIIAVSEDLRDIIIKELKITSQRVSVLYNPIPEFIKTNTTEDEKSLIDGKPYILAAGRLTQQKDFLGLVRAFSKISNVIDHRLVIIGEGEERKNIEAEIKLKHLDGRVILPGFIKNPCSMMSKADLFVLSSLYEGMPNVLIQAMSLGIPVVATNCPTGPREILDDGKWGELVAVGDPDALAAAILKVLNSDDLPDVKKRTEIFDVEACLDQLENTIGFTSNYPS